MTVIVKRVTKAEQHLNADFLRVYQMTDDKTTLQIVANLTNVYDVGDHVLVANIGSILKEDNLEIRQTKIRGINSFGMALGKTDLPVGTDVSDQYCTEMPQMSGRQLSPWVDIESLFNIRKNLKAQNDLKKIKYRCKTKIDGSNGGIQIHPDGSLVIQSRGQIITPENDNAGFAKWVMSKEDYWKSLKTDIPIIVFGEWCGPGINKNCAINQIPNKIFCVFAIEYHNEFTKNIHFGPSYIEYMLGLEHNDIFSLPFLQEEFELDYTDPDILQKQADELNILCAKVEKCDPFVKENFNIEGIGEGFVMYPIIDNNYIINKQDFSDLIFKVKGSLHKVVKTKESAQIDPEVATNIEEFVKLFVTENRLNQFAEKVGPFDMKNTGQFIKLFSQDVLKESTSELEASQMDWKMVGGPIGNAAREWWMNKCKDLNN